MDQATVPALLLAPREGAFPRLAGIFITDIIASVMRFCREATRIDTCALPWVVESWVAGSWVHGVSMVGPRGWCTFPLLGA